jgi:hypothetical protein
MNSYSCLQDLFKTITNRIKWEDLRKEMSAPENWYKPNSPKNTDSKNHMNCPLTSAGVALRALVLWK